MATITFTGGSSAGVALAKACQGDELRMEEGRKEYHGKVERLRRKGTGGREVTP
jgi:hypothetical protein